VSYDATQRRYAFGIIGNELI